MRTLKLIGGCVIIASLVIIASCSKNHNEAPNYNSDKVRLKTVIDSLINVYNNSIEGSKPGQYVIGAKVSLDSVIKLGQQVISGSYTQEQVNNAVRSLMAAGTTFQSRLLQEVSVINLMAYWKFNGNANDSSGHGHDGALKTNYIGASAAVAVDGGTLPVLVADRFGRPNQAYNFSNGAYIEVPYSSELNPQNLTISAWVKMHVSTPSNYIVSLNRWNGYKFQLQSNNFPFFTFHDTNNNYHDIDANPGALSIDVWTHVALTYTNGTMSFYIDGTPVKTFVVTGVPVTVTPPVNFAIGNELPKSQYNLVSDANPQYFWGASYFNGALDDIRIYNTALPAAAILSIYTQERSL